MKDNRFGLYMHIPFCRSKCLYCDFPSYAHMERWQERVIKRMKEELEETRKEIGERHPTTVYIGGGTPSILEPALFSGLMQAAEQCFPPADHAEISIEMNPGTVSEAFLEASKRAGVNRVSLGAQSMNDHLLRSLGRIHTSSDIVAAVKSLKEYGFHNFNLDMMIGLPEQTLDDVRMTLDQMISMDPTHISCYSLIVEENTGMYERVNSGKVRLPDEGLEREMYYEAKCMLADAGYRQYEISNFAKLGFECRHNLDCWHREDYLGIGVSAASLLNNERRRNPFTVSAYLAGQSPEIIPIDASEAQFESIMLGLRLNDGIADSDFFKRHGVHLLERFGNTINRLVQRELLEWNGDNLRCTERGLDIQNEVLTEFMD